MDSAELRKTLRATQGPRRDPRLIHELGRAYGRERIHLAARPPRGARRGDKLWAADGRSYKVVTRTLEPGTTSATFEVSASDPADQLLMVLIDRKSLQLVEVARAPWTMVEWLGRRHGSRWRLRWAEGSALRGVAEIL